MVETAKLGFVIIFALNEINECCTNQKQKKNISKPYKRNEGKFIEVVYDAHVLMHKKALHANFNCENFVQWYRRKRKHKHSRNCCAFKFKLEMHICCVCEQIVRCGGIVF